MNKSSNVFNSAPLGSRGSTNMLYVTALQECSALLNAIVTKGRLLKHSAAFSIICIGKLLQGKSLKSTANSAASTQGKLLGYYGVYLESQAPCSVTSTALLTKCVPITFQSNISCSVTSFSKLTKRVLITLKSNVSCNAINSSKLTKYTAIRLSKDILCIAETSGNIKKSIPKALAFECNASINTSASLGGFIFLKSTVICSGFTLGKLNESSSTQASISRIGVVPSSPRTIYISKEL